MFCRVCCLPFTGSQICGTGWGRTGYAGPMQKLTLGLCLLSLGTSASAQTAASLRSELLDIAESAVKTLPTVQNLGEVNQPSNTTCVATGKEVLALMDKIENYRDRTEIFFNSPTNEQHFYIRQASGALFASATSMLAAVNRFCSPTILNPEMARLYLHIADLKLDIFDLHLFKVGR